MKTLKDFYIVVTKQNKEELKNILNIKNLFIDMCVQFESDDKDVYISTYSIPENKERISLSKLKRYIDNTPTREGLKKAQNALKLYKYKYEKYKKENEEQAYYIEEFRLELKELSHSNERLQDNLENLRTEREQLTNLAKKDVNLCNKTLVEWALENYNVCLDYDRLNSEKVDLESELRVKERINNELIKDNTMIDKELRKYKIVAMCSLLLTLLVLGLWF